MEKLKQIFSDKQKLLPILVFVIGLVSMVLAYIFVNGNKDANNGGDEDKAASQITPIQERVQDTNEAVSPTVTPKVSATPTVSPTPTVKPSEPTNTPTPSPTPEPQTKTLSSSSGLDGFRANNNAGNDSIEIRAGNGAMVGSPSYELVTRGFVSFDIDSLPDNAKIQKATLRLYQYKVDGTPYASGGGLKIDHLDYGSSLDSADYNASAISTNIATLTQNAGVEWKDADVTSALQKDVDEGHSRSQYRLKFTTEEDGDGDTDVAYFYSANAGSNTNPPQLIISYTD